MIDARTVEELRQAAHMLSICEGKDRDSAKKLIAVVIADLRAIKKRLVKIHFARAVPIILAALLFGCGRAPVVDGGPPINTFDVADVFEAAGVPDGCRYTCRSKFLCPTAKWFTNEFTGSWEARMVDLGIRRPTSTFVCQDFTRACTSYVAEMGRGLPAALAVFEFWYQPDKASDGHAVVVALVRDPALRLVFIEPQSPARVVSLSRDEIQSCLLIR